MNLPVRPGPKSHALRRCNYDHVISVRTVNCVSQEQQLGDFTVDNYRSDSFNFEEEN